MSNSVAWPAPTRVAFRFCLAYFVLYGLAEGTILGVLGSPFWRVPWFGELPAAQRVVEWTARSLFGAQGPLVFTGSGSGDKTADWVLAFCALAVAFGVTVAWSLAARREEYRALHGWLHLLVRFTLASELISYGAVKAIPMQMPFPGLSRLVEPYGHFSPMGVLWYSIGASRPYEIFTGCVEIGAGLLLCIPQTATLGALLSLACAGQVFTLNMSYDVPVKLASFHLVLMCLVLLAPDARRLLDFFVRDRAAAASQLAPLGSSSKAIRVGRLAQAAFGLYLVVVNVAGAVRDWGRYGDTTPKSPLYGIWNVAYLSIDGVERPPLIVDAERWRRVVLDRPASASFQRMDDSFAAFGARIDVNRKTLQLTKREEPKWSATLSFERPAMNRLSLEGEMDGHRLVMRLELYPRERFLLVSRGFHWVQEYPFNR